MRKKITYTKLTAVIIIITLIITLVTASLYGEVMKKRAIYNLSKEDAEKSTMFIFESLYSAMAKGWTKQDLSEIIIRLNEIDPKMKINVYRNTLVSKLFGEIKEDKAIRENDFNVKKAMTGEKVLEIMQNNKLRFYYPIVAQQKCLNCHSNVQIDDILGTIYISYPVEKLKLSLTSMINFFIIFIALFSLLIFLSLFFEFNRYLLKPLQSFINNIKTITTDNNLSTRINIKDDIQEIHSMQGVFNTMLDSIEYQFYYDSLTSLYNRKKLLDQLDKRKNATLLIINIDSFQEINDFYGNDIGDNVLKAYANLLQSMLPNHNFSLYRLHADEFAILCTQNFDLDEIESFATLIVETTSHNEFIIDKKTHIFISATIGISYEKNLLLPNADIALKFAKKQKRKFLFYQSDMQAEHEYEQNLSWTKKIKEAIEDNRIEPLFQPIVSCNTQEIVKYEALMRMVAQDGEYIAPLHFLELAKRNKLYSDLTKIIITKTFDIFLSKPTKVSINLSLQDILNTEIVNLIIEKLSLTQMGDRVIFEILESEGIENFEQVICFIEKVKTYGCQISIDDFGTGYSNFEYLMKLQVDYIKIDASMIKNIDKDKNSAMVTQTIIEFAKKMKIKTIAEFVHSKAVFDKISQIGVDYAQGYYFGEPQKL